MNAPASRSLALAACGLALLAAGAPASARDFVADQAGMFSAATVAQLNARIASFNAQTGKELVVVTTPSLGGATLQGAASTAFAARAVNGVLIFIARDDRKDIIVPDRAGAQAGWFTPDVLRSIRTSMEAQFRSESYDAGITGAVGAILNVYRTHLGGLQRPAGAGGVPATRATSTSGGLRIPMFWWIIIAIVGFLLVRSILRALAAPRYYGGAPGAPPPGAGYGPGYGPGYGYGGFGGGGSFWSGLLGGLGGAWLGNELFRGGGIAPASGAPVAPDAGGGWGGADSGGWQSDAGQADVGGASGGDWSGGGFGGDAGGGDFGGGDGGGGW
ncbi:MAG: TPM domain-containing protein [Candidatus Eremiobacteraeota bacterium]|nr:TPM domain-containing protein [Candidatus Eremiobacteraeota bacterium]MBV8499984.1 TPM domain-containing protein [Candidatus Eremiobacteraeota bacterium]